MDRVIPDLIWILLTYICFFMGRGKEQFELSVQVKKGRYANFPQELVAPEKIFMLGYEECASDYAIKRQSFPFWTLEFIAGGHGFYREGKQQHKLRHGAVFTYGPGVEHAFGNEPDRPFRKYFMVCRGKEYPSIWKDAGLMPGRLYQMGGAASIISIFDRMIDEGTSMDSQTSTIISGLEMILFSLMERHRGTARGIRSGSRQAFETAMDLVQRDYRNLHSLADLAECSGYSGEYLCRIFKKHHGESPYRVLIHRKMSAAWLLLRAGRLKVSSVASELGYEDPLHFSRTFRKVMGCPPSSVRTLY
ncbi:MAG: AraC family transcriptional regulator [Coraliomargaritaceae bacterium]